MNDADILGWAGCMGGGVMAALVARQARRSLMPWLFVLGMFAFAVASACFALAALAVSPQEMVHWQVRRLQVAAFLPGFWLWFSLGYSRGNYLEYLRAWRFTLVAAFVVPVGLVLGFQDRLILGAGQAVAGGPWIFRLGISGIILNLVLLLSAVLVLMNLERTYRAAIGTMRWRIKFMVLGLGVIFAVQVYACSQVLLFHNQLNLSLEVVETLALLLGCGLVLRSLFRRGHFDADIYPSPSDVFNSLTVLLGGVYFLIVGVFAKVVEFLGGDTGFMLKALIILLGLVLGTLLLVSDRARLLTRQFASRHFQKPLYDYRSLWRRFTEETASCVRQSELCEVTVKLTSDVFQALSVTLWLVDDKKENLLFAGSTVLSAAKVAALAPQGSEAMQVMRALEDHPDPVDIDTAIEPWAEVLRRCHPDEFRKGGHRVCVPLLGGGQLLGVLILGDRVGGMPFSWQDFDLLKCVSDSVAADLLNIQLSQKLLQAGQLEAFQTMSAFFVHDLKNTASTLNLMLKNLPVHFDDPAFRADALRGIGKTVAHINRLIERLGQLRSGLQVKLAGTDLNELVLQVLAGLGSDSNIRVVKSLQPLPEILLDAEQLRKVVTNLVFNAREAVAADGELRIATSQSDGWAVLTVADNGCGMSPEFLNRSLFRAFQTTKKSGLGIGLFQSKIIVEAHQGKIQVASQPGEGTTFQIFLPLRKPKS